MARKALLIAALAQFACGLLFAQDSVPALSLRDQSGTQHTLADYKGKIVVLNFWATWCVPCKDEMPIFGEVQRQFGDRGVIVLAASLDDETTKKFIPRFARSYKMNFPILLDAGPEQMRTFGLGEMVPSTVFIDRDGSVATKIMGQATKHDVLSRVEWLVGDRTGPPPERVVDHAGKKR